MSRANLIRGVGRQSLYISRTSSGISMNLSVLASCLINSSGNRGDKSSGVTGSKVLGCNGGGGLTDRSAITLYHWQGISTGLTTAFAAALTLQPFESLGCAVFAFNAKDPRNCSPAESNKGGWLKVGKFKQLVRTIKKLLIKVAAAHDLEHDLHLQK